MISSLNRPIRRAWSVFTRFAVCGVLAILMATSVVAAAAADDEPVTSGGEALMRRLSPDQYKRIIIDIFGPSIQLGGRFEPETRANGLLAVGAGRVGVTSTGLEQYDSIARAIAAQVVDEKHRSLLIPCKPASETAPDDACATQFLSRAGELLYRRPLTQAELQGQVQIASTAATSLKSFYSGLRLSLAGMLDSPQFIFRKETAEADPDHAGQYRLDAYSKAAQISFLLWNDGPDQELMAAAARGDLSSKSGLTKQVDRMLASPKLEYGVRAFFSDMFGFNDFDMLSKDAVIYPKFTAEVARDAQEQTLRTISDLLLKQRGDYRDLFTTRKTFLTPVLGSVYSVPVVKTTPNGQPTTWTPYEYPEGDPRAGLLSQVSFVALHSHPGRSSPTIRGKALREIMLCQKVPDPPGNVNFTVVQDTSNPQYRTARDRLTAHRTNPACAGCHKLIDPMGLAMENFDGAGSFRTNENGAPIDVSGELDGAKFNDPSGLGKAMHDNPSTASCLVNKLYSYAVGRVAAKGEAEWVKYLEKGFAADGYRVPDLLRRIAASDAYYRVTAPQTGALNGTPSKLASDTMSTEENRK